MISKQSLYALVTVVLAVAISGCAGLPKGPSDEELIRESLNTWKTGVESEDVDLMMTVVSEDFVGPEGASKPAFRQYIAALFDNGTLLGAEMIIEGATPVIAGDMATVDNLGLSSSRGAVVIDFDLKKEEDGVWRIVNMQAY